MNVYQTTLLHDWINLLLYHRKVLSTAGSNANYRHNFEKKKPPDCSASKMVDNVILKATVSFRYGDVTAMFGAHVVWHSGLTCDQSGDILRIWRRDFRTIQSHRFTTSSESITRCNLTKLSDCLSFAMRLEDNPRTRHLIPPPTIAVHGYNLRKANDFTLPMIKTKRYKQSPVPYFVTLLKKH